MNNAAIITESAPPTLSNVTFREIAELAVKGLGRMFDAETGLFCTRAIQKSGTPVRVGISLQNSLIALIGLFRAHSSGLSSEIDINQALDRICARLGDIGNAGDFGLLLWACAVANRADLKLLCNRADVSTLLTRYVDARARRTMELAWLLTGLCSVAMTDKTLAEPLRSVAFRTFDLLMRNQEACGLFRHSSRRHSISGSIRAHIGSFADQIYPVLAMSVFAKTYSVDAAVENALKCARALCETQGLEGQWWWHYDVLRGKVISKYPVYSVHQDGMAPMSLLTLSQVSGVDFGQSIYKGLQWIGGQNELSYDLRDKTLCLIWRNIHLTACRRYLEETRHVLGRTADAFRAKDLRVLLECHSYHLGWILNAFAAKCELDREHENAINRSWETGRDDDNRHSGQLFF